MRVVKGTAHKQYSSSLPDCPKIDPETDAARTMLKLDQFWEPCIFFTPTSLWGWGDAGQYAL